MKRYETPFGAFSEDGREYVIRRPDTPKPWVNVICPGDYGLVISQAGSGYSWQTHASLNRINRWEQDLVRDEWGKYLYCRDLDTGEYWSLTYQPVRARASHWQVRHGVGYSVFEARHGDIESTLTVFVPADAPLEIWSVTLRNRGRRRRRLELTSYLEWNLGPSPDTHREFHRLFIETEVVQAAGTMLATKRLSTIAEHGRGTSWNVEWPHVAFHAVSGTLADWESDKQRFIGRNGSLASPAAMRAVRLSRTTGKWQDGVGALRTRTVLAPGRAKKVHFTLGVADTRAEALRLARRYRSERAISSAWKGMERHWKRLLSPLEVETPEPAFDLLTNTWLKYQAISCRLWGRTAYFQTGGAYGYRDQLQDSQVFLPLAPEETRKQLLLHAAHQFADGTAWHWWHPLTGEGLRKPLNDDLLWLPFVTLNYLRETADFAVLDAKAPFMDERGKPSKDVGTLYEHCRRAIDSFWGRLSPRGVPRMGAGDWNDGLSAIGAKGKSESVWLGQFLVGILEGWSEMESHRKRPDRRTAAKYAREARKMRAAINRHFWDGDWYQRATRDDGTVIGSRKNREGRIFLNTQTWAVLHDIASPTRTKKLLRSLERHLYGDYGPLLLRPAYKTPDASIGYLTRYSPGSRENGGLYTHAGLWAIQAECKLGRREQAWKLWKSFCPIDRGMKPEHYEVEPYVMPGNVDGPDSPHYGRGGWTWYTGSAAWTWRIATEWILGVRPTWEGLLVRPCLPPRWKGFRMTRRFRGATYQIDVRAGGRTRQVLVDGVAQKSDVIAPFADGKTHRVSVTLGPGAK